MKPAHFVSLLIFPLLLLSAAHVHAAGQPCDNDFPPKCSNTETCQIPQGQTTGTCVAGTTTIGGTQTTDIGGSRSGNCGGGLCNPLGTTSDLPSLLDKVLAAVVEIGTVLVILMLVYCGFLFVTAQGNEEKIRDARSALLWTVIGAIILLGARVLAGVIASTVDTL